MKLSKRLAAGVLAAAMALSLLTACGGTGGASGEEPANSSSTAEDVNTGTDEKTDAPDNTEEHPENKDDQTTPPKEDTDKDNENKPDQPETPSGPVKPASWEETWTYRYFQKFNGFPEGFLLDFGMTSKEIQDYREYYVYDRVTNRGYVKVHYGIGNGEVDELEWIILYSEPVKDKGYMCYMIYGGEEEDSEKYAVKTPMNISEVIQLEPSCDAFDTLTVDEDYSVAGSKATYYAESMWMDYDGKTFSGLPGEHGSGKAEFTYCYDKTTGELKYIVTPKELIQINQISKNFDHDLVNYQKYQIVASPSV